MFEGLCEYHYLFWMGRLVRNWEVSFQNPEPEMSVRSIEAYYKDLLSRKKMRLCEAVDLLEAAAEDEAACC